MRSEKIRTTYGILILTAAVVCLLGACGDPEPESEVLETIAIEELSAGSIVEERQLEGRNIEELFYSEELSEEILSRINGISYRENPHITTDELRYLRLLHWGFDEQTHVGELIVNEQIAQDVLEIMRRLYENGYPIEKMVLVDAYQADDEASMSDNNTSAFNYRLIAGTDHLSKHGQGMAIDINPRYNPCVRTGETETVIEPANGAEYAERTREFSYKIEEGDLCRQLFLEYGFTWGGDWENPKDYQHFEKP